ncbi:uncharacterized protein [Physcomitrium patens]|uniref:Timeless N-terminal domain-containing protein n=1 Tax=Physcomitrium patens TaxID=3218 RepID=A0A2K1K890_PHYPA|nr:hypothetical protein PHYPA_011892 [Physcomitrium patens]
MDVDHVTAVCTGLGSLRESGSGRAVYVKHADCLANLRHLQRFLRRDDPVQRDIFMQLGKWNSIRQDILPIINHYRHDFDLVLNAVKVMVFLTMPIDPSSTDIPQQLEYLRQFKSAVLEDDSIGVIVSHLQDPLEHMESGTLTDMDGKMFQLVLTLIRNLLAVDDPSSSLVRASVASPQALYVKDALIERLFNENVMDLLLALIQHVGGEQPFLRHDNLLILEIFNYLFSGQMPDVIASSYDEAHAKSKSQPSGAALEALMAKEREERRNRGFVGPRHSNFCGMFVRVGKDGSKTMVTRNPYQSPLDNLFQKPEIKRGQVKKVASDLPVHVPSNSTVCSMLKVFADQLLEGNYNLLMQTIIDDIRGERNNVQSQDIVMFFAVAKFFTAYQRCHLMKKPNEGVQSAGERGDPAGDSGPTFQGRCGRIASTMDEDMFILVTMKWQCFVENAKLSNDWFPATSSGELLKEMIHMLDYILKAADRNSSEGQQEVRVARILLYKVFYDHTENGILPFICRLIKTFDIHKQPRSQLAGLVETTHIVLRLLDSITKEDGALRVKKKARGTKKSSKLSRKKGVQPSGSTRKEPDHKSGSIHEVEESNTSNEPLVAPEDPNSNTLLSNILHAQHADTNFGPVEDIEVAGVEGHHGVTDEHDFDEVEDKEVHDVEESEMDSEEEEEEEVQTKEETLDVMKCVRMFADNSILHNYCWLLKNYLLNTPAINYYIVRMLQRISQDCMMEPMLYQLSILQTCYEILSNHSLRNSEQHQYVIAFLTSLVRHLFEKLKSSPMLFVDILFWKSKQDCHCITANYMIHDLKKFSSSGKTLSKWAQLEDRRSLLDGLGDDDDDDSGKETHAQNRRALLNSLGDGDDDLGNDGNLPSVETLFSNKEKGKVKRQKAVKKKGLFTDFQEDLIKDLFKTFEKNRSCNKLIAEGLEKAGAVQDSGEPFTPSQIGRGLKRLGLARVVGKITQNKFLRNIRNDSENEDGSDSDNQENTHHTDAQRDHDPDSRSDEEISEEEDIAGPGGMKGLLESLDEESDDEDSNQDDILKNDVLSAEKNDLKGSKKKRKSGISEISGGNEVPKRRRKSGLFSKEQDHKLQSLFEKYKGMTRFKHLISNDLEGDFTTAQIERRLQQLGCVEPRKRKSKLAQMSDDEDKSEKEDDVEPNPDDSKEGQHADINVSSAFKASWGLSARKHTQINKPTADVHHETQQGDSSDDNIPLAQHLSMRNSLRKKKAHPNNEGPREELEVGMGVGGENTGAKDAADEIQVSGVVVSCELPRPSEVGMLEDQPKTTNSASKDCDSDDQLLEKSETGKVSKVFQRKRRQSGRHPIEGVMDKFEVSDGDRDDAIINAKKTHERKRRPSLEPKRSTWGDSDTDVSDIEDTQDLAAALQEVRIYDNHLASTSKKRRLQRKQTSSNDEVDVGGEELVTISSGVESYFQDDTTLEEHLLTRKGARKALIDAMTSDEDE